MNADAIPLWAVFAGYILAIFLAIEAGYLVMSDAPGWGVEVNETAIRAHPPRR